MKKTLSLVLICLTLFLALTACNTTEITSKEKNHDTILEFIEKRGDVNDEKHTKVHMQKSLLKFNKFTEETKNASIPDNIKPKNQ